MLKFRAIVRALAHRPALDKWCCLRQHWGCRSGGLAESQECVLTRTAVERSPPTDRRPLVSFCRAFRHSFHACLRSTSLSITSNICVWCSQIPLLLWSLFTPSIPHCSHHLTNSSLMWGPVWINFEPAWSHVRSQSVESRFCNACEVPVGPFSNVATACFHTFTPVLRRGG